jgi:hypothetical protein
MLLIKRVVGESENQANCFPPIPLKIRNFFQPYGFKTPFF